jgi:hypothetical protein
MVKKAAIAVAVLLAMIPSAAIGQERADALARKLPAEKTAVFVQVDVRMALDYMEKALTFPDTDAGQKVIYQVKTLYATLTELAARHEFRPLLFQSIADTNLYFVLMAKDQPEVKVHKSQMPKFDEDTGKLIPGEFEEHTWTQKSLFTASLVLKTAGEPVAANFMQEFKAMLDRQKDAHPDIEEYGRRDIEVEVGELVGDASGESTMGRVEDYIIFSSDNPKELWAAMTAAPEKTVADTALYKKLMEPQDPQVLAVVNTQLLVRELDNYLKTSLDEAEKASAAGQGQADEWAGMASAQVQMAREIYTVFTTVKNLLSLDQWQSAGARTFAEAREDRMSGDFTGLVCYGEPLSAVMTELLRGSGSFGLPPTSGHGEVFVAGRVGFARIYTEVINALRASNPLAMAMFEGGMSGMKAQVGVEVADILSALAGDFYLLLNVVEKEREVTQPRFDEEKEEVTTTTEKRTGPVAEMALLWGLADPQRANDMFSKAFTALSADPETNSFIKKRTYQETDVFCLGPGAADSESYPDGLTSFAATIVDRYLAVGAWESVTGVIRKAKSGGRETSPELQGILDKHKDANLLVVVPADFQKRLQKMSEDAMRNGEDPFNFMLQMLEQSEMDVGDEETSLRIKSSVHDLVLAYKELSTKGQSLTSQTGVLSGELKGNFYELQMMFDVRK